MVHFHFQLGESWPRKVRGVLGCLQNLGPIEEPASKYFISLWHKVKVIWLRDGQQKVCDHISCSICVIRIFAVLSGALKGPSVSYLSVGHLWCLPWLFHL